MLGSFIYFCVYIFIHTMIRLGWWRWRVEGRENLPPRKQGGMVIVMNHLNWVDIPAVGALVPFAYRLSWLGKSELFEHPAAGCFFRTMHVIPIRRGKRDVAALNAAVQALKDGAVLLIFPEGTRSRNEGLQEGHGGAVRLAMQAGVPIVPAGIVGSEHGPPGTLTRKPLLLRFGRPYTIAPAPDSKIPLEVMEQLTDEMMRRIAALLPEEYRGVYLEAGGRRQEAGGRRQ